VAAPYTVEEVARLAKEEGKKRIAVIAPAFSADCIETLEEINEEIHESFEEAGGEEFTYIPCLNDDEAHIGALRRKAAVPGLDPELFVQLADECGLGRFARFDLAAGETPTGPAIALPSGRWARRTRPSTSISATAGRPGPVSRPIVRVDRRYSGASGRRSRQWRRRPKAKVDPKDQVIALHVAGGIGFAIALGLTHPFSATRMSPNRMVSGRGRQPPPIFRPP
jgi:hypothetical protein